MTTTTTENNGKNEPTETSGYFKQLQIAGQRLGDANERGNIARGDIVTAFIMLGKVDQDFRDMVASRSVALLASTSDATKAETAAARLWFADLLKVPELKTKDDFDDDTGVDSSDNRNRVNVMQAAIKHAARVIVCVNELQLWEEFSKSNVKGMVRLTLTGAKKLWTEKSFSTVDGTYITIGHKRGVYRFATFADAGVEMLKKKGIIKPSNGSKVRQMRADNAEEMRLVIENTESRTINDKHDNALAAFALLISLVDTLNSADVRYHLSSAAVAPLRNEATALMAKIEEDKKAKLLAASAEAAKAKPDPKPDLTKAIQDKMAEENKAKAA